MIHYSGSLRASRGRSRSAWRLLLPLAFLAAATVAHAQPLTFDAALEHAVRRSPDLEAQALEIQAAQASAIPAGALPDPKLFVGVDQFPITGPAAFNPAREDMTMLSVGVMQDVPNRAKRRARTAVAQAEIDVARAGLAFERRTVLAAAAAAWLHLYYHEPRLAVLEKLERENRLLAEVTPDRIASRTALPAQAVDPGLETASVANRRAALTREAEEARAELARWIGAAGRHEIAGEAPTFRVDPAGLRAGLDEHPRLEAYGPAVARAEAQARELEATRRPDYSVQGAFHARHPDFGQMVSAQVTIDLPLFAARRQNPRIEAARLQANRLRVERQAARRALEAELEKTLAQHASVTEQVARLRREALPLAARKVDLQLASFQAGEIAFDPVLEARRERVETELEIADLEAEAAALAARLVIYFGRQDR